MRNNQFLKIQSLKKLFPVRSGLFSRRIEYARAVDDVSFSTEEGETFGIVGESGCGKTTLARTILRLVEPTSGSIIFEGKEITHLNMRELKPLRQKMQIIFQDPYRALHPRRNVQEIVREPLEAHNLFSKSEIKDKVVQMLRNVGLSTEHLNRYPHQLSGGERQRVVIARALILNPTFVILDEPTSALDASVQALILNLIRKLQKEMNLTYLLISHHMSVVEHLSDRIGVMYLGKIVEIGPNEEVFLRPLHPYTQALLSSIPKISTEVPTKRIILQGDVPSPINPPKGCRFHTRCPYSEAICREEEPLLRPAGKDRLVACHFWEEIQALYPTT